MAILSSRTDPNHLYKLLIFYIFILSDHVIKPSAKINNAENKRFREYFSLSPVIFILDTML
jgi:hypothetical protein